MPQIAIIGAGIAGLNAALTLYGAVLSAPPHDAPLSAIGKREYRMPSALALDAGA